MYIYVRVKCIWGGKSSFYYKCHEQSNCSTQTHTECISFSWERLAMVYNSWKWAKFSPFCCLLCSFSSQLELILIRYGLFSLTKSQSQIRTHTKNLSELQVSEKKIGTFNGYTTTLMNSSCTACKCYKGSWIESFSQIAWGQIEFKIESIDLCAGTLKVLSRE